MKNNNALGEGPPDEDALRAANDALAQLVHVICLRMPRALLAVVASPARGPWSAIAACGEPGHPESGQSLETPEHEWMRAGAKSASVGLAADSPASGGPLRFREAITLRDGSFFGNFCLVAARADAAADAGLREAVAAFADLAALLIGQSRGRAAAEKGHADAERGRATAQEGWDDEAASGEQRERFVAVFAHDLRSPLSTIQALGQTMQAAPGRANAAAIAKMLLAAVARMAALIDDVLDLARARLGGGIPMRWERCANLGERLEQIARDARAVRPDREIRADIRLSRPIDCDPGRLQQMLGNLLDNALSHGAPGRPISVAARVSGEEFSIRVKNEGADLDEESSARMFEPFWRPRGATRPEGLGLGLFICEHIARQHSGAIGVESQGGSTTFVFSMPTTRA